LNSAGAPGRGRQQLVEELPGGGAGTGLVGLAQRAEALDGRLDVVSPPGGPTTITMTLPSTEHP